ncbi:class I SAM-dependent methyltransferase [Sphingobium sufflavum]|uniref:class I SAM-dependent methyltransferase n=1 Tax=Sphingobium sufflavum TaxID=1129547 RepID=UPI001F2DA76A|nr:class I SAM-dependent methyltransferase [Sphingobium sufflavum]MCE7797546.1 class I SAM-dependent methyltransferase [Sphingobium sufflavum]
MLETGIASGPGAHGRLMDAQYRWQRHVYDLSRKYYLLGRDRMIRALDVPDGGSVLELGCGTGRNLALVARRYPAACLHGIDISAEMLKNARRNAPTALLARGDATRLDAALLLSRSRFDRIFMSYTLSMIPDWQGALDQAARLLAPGGRLHVVDFGQQESLPRWFRRLLMGWLARFHVTPRADLFAAGGACAARHGLRFSASPSLRGYAWTMVLERPLDGEGVSGDAISGERNQSRL